MSYHFIKHGVVAIPVQMNALQGYAFPYNISHCLLNVKQKFHEKRELNTVFQNEEFHLIN